MTLQNRVTPEGGIVAHPARGTLMGNRGGRLHHEDRSLGPARWRSKAWIACVLDFRGRWREVMGRGYTELFFLDEATAWAAGHRPCAECRRADFSALLDTWETAFGARPRAAGIDAALHAARVRRDRSKVTFAANAATLPDGTMIRTPAGPALLLGDTVLPWSPEGYDAPATRPDGPVEVLTPEPVVALFHAGLRPGVHTSAEHPGLHRP